MGRIPKQNHFQHVRAARLASRVGKDSELTIAQIWWSMLLLDQMLSRLQVHSRERGQA